MGDTKGRGVKRALRLREQQYEVDDELAFHFASTVDELVRGGATRAEAEREAKRRFGDVNRYRRELRRIDRGMNQRRRWSRRADTMESTMRQVLRGIARAPGLAVGVVLAFALGIGANATMFGIVDRLLLSPPAHVTQPDDVKRLVVDRYISFLNDRVQGTSIAYADYRDFDQVSQFASVAAFQPQQITLGRGEEAERAAAVMVTSSWWSLLGVQPAIGRFFTADEDRIGGVSVAVLGHALWQGTYGGDPSVLGRTIDFGHGEYTVIGVAPKGFTGVDLTRVDVWLPLHTTGAQINGERAFDDTRGYYWLRAVGRLSQGAGVAAAEAAATSAHRAGRERDIGAGRYDAEVRIVAAPLIVARAALQAAREQGVGRMFFGSGASREASVALWLVGVAAIVLLIACVNVANLLLARAIRQRRETAIRVALGVSRARLIGQTVAEGLILAGMGGVAAIVVTRWGGDLVRGVLLPGVEFADNGLSARVIPFVLVLSILAGLVAAIVPALEATRRDLAETMRVTSGGITRSAHRVRAVLSMAQAALSVILLVGAGLFVRSLNSVRALDLGFDPDGLLVAMPVADGGSLTEEEKRSFFPAAAERLNAQPAVTSVAWSQGVPYYSSWTHHARVPGRDSLPQARSGGPYINGVNLDYFRTLDLRILRGRTLESADLASGLAVVINEALADLYWPGEDPLGSCMHIGSDNPPCSTIVGIVENARRGSIMEDPNPQFYVPNTNAAITDFGQALFIRVRNDDGATIQEIRRTLLSLSPRLRFVNIQPISEMSAVELRAWRLGATMFTVFGLLALLVAALGLYSVLAFDVAQRTREIGLRNALGASTRRILSIVVGRAVRITLVGVTIGIVAALLLAPRVQQLLFDTPARDPLTITVVVVMLLITAIVAASVPAWRAARVDPNVALRAE
jgi:predicted permease